MADSGYVGVPYRVVYIASNNLSGLNNVVAYIYRPDNVQQGPLKMNEIGGVFSGFYALDYITLATYPTGKYLISVRSPFENKIQSDSFSLYKEPSDGSNIVLMDIVTGYIESDEVIGMIEPNDWVIGFIEDSYLNGYIPDNDDLEGELD